MGCEEICETLASTGVTALPGLAALVVLIHGGVTIRSQLLCGRGFGPRWVTTLVVGLLELWRGKGAGFCVVSEPLEASIQVLELIIVCLF